MSQVLRNENQMEYHINQVLMEEDMENPCRHCDKADDRKETVLKCDKPCRQGKDWYECEKLVIEFLQGKIII